MKRNKAKQFLKEYQHWADGGDVLYKLECDDNWYPVDEEFEINTHHSVEAWVINDKYVEPRKAYALGEQLQFFNDLKNKWIDVISKPCWCKDYEYRIKPKKWYEDERNIGKIILVNLTDNRDQSQPKLFKRYDKRERLPFIATDNSKWGFAWLIEPYDLAKEER